MGWNLLLHWNFGFQVSFCAFFSHFDTFPIILSPYFLHFSAISVTKKKHNTFSYYAFS